MSKIIKRKLARKIRSFLRKLKREKFILYDLIYIPDEDPDFESELTFNDFSDIDYIVENLEEHWNANDDKKDDKSTIVNLKSSYEEALYNFIFTIYSNKLIYHYTSTRSLFKILDSEQLRLFSIAGLNDRGELSLANDLLKGKKTIPYSGVNLKQARRRFIISCSEKSDHLNSWRLYGDDGKGVSIGFKMEHDRNMKIKNFALGRIIYDDKLVEYFKKLIDDIRDNLHIKFGFNRFFLWKNFIKLKDYAEEKEVRLLYYNYDNQLKHKEVQWDLNRYGILNTYLSFDLFNSEIPLSIKEITFGPKHIEENLNTKQFQKYLRVKKMQRIKIQQSDKKHYR